HSAEVAVSAAFGQSTRLRATTIPLPPTRLSPAENLAWRRLPAQGRRRADWLLGRAALKLLMDGDDTSAVAFPHPHLSLSHSAGIAVAAGSVGNQAGLGVDFEGWRLTDPRTARFFLHDGERVQDGELLRLWTVKEALFKATPANAGGRLLDYRLTDPAAAVGTAVDVRGHAFRYVSGCLDGSGPLAVAICAGSADAPV
ncbi:MAG: hypothetical protein ABR540_14865, partial [Acidimicrobiales bacterium]